jgi:hypothetical protein
MSNEDIDTQINALLDMTNSYAEAVYLVCLDIQIKESK